MALSVTAFQVMFATMAGYGFAKKQFPGRELLFWILREFHDDPQALR